MRLGFHISISGGFTKVVARAQDRECETIQLFSRNPRGWKYNELNPSEIKIFKEEIAIADIDPVFIHMPYLPNLATGKKDLFKVSVSSLQEELKRSELIGAKYVIMHVGNRGEITAKEALKNIVIGINRTLKEVNSTVTVLLENTAGMGTEIGYRFEEIEEIIDGTIDKERIGVVLDTAHSYEAGYDLRDRLDDVVGEFESTIGLEFLKLLHLNDSKTPLGSKVDRHYHIGKGEIGLEGFKRIVNHEKLRDIPGIMETPRENVEDDMMNMKTLRSLIEKNH